MYRGKFILRFEDTDPRTKKPKIEYYQQILDDVEWFCAIAAGFNAGYSIMVQNPKGMLKCPQNKVITKAMSEWEKARKADVFPKELKKYLQHPFAEFHLEAIGNGKWKLYPRPNFFPHSCHNSKLKIHAK